MRVARNHNPRTCIKLSATRSLICISTLASRPLLPAEQLGWISQTHPSSTLSLSLSVCLFVSLPRSRPTTPSTVRLLPLRPSFSSCWPCLSCFSLSFHICVCPLSPNLVSFLIITLIIFQSVSFFLFFLQPLSRFDNLPGRRQVAGFSLLSLAVSLLFLFILPYLRLSFICESCIVLDDNSYYFPKCLSLSLLSSASTSLWQFTWSSGCWTLSSLVSRVSASLYLSIIMFAFISEFCVIGDY